MAGDKWILLADAADFVGTKDVPLRIELAGMLGAIRLRGVRPGEREPVEIPASEAAGLRIDCFRSRLILGRLLTMYERVQMRWVDVERLEHADVERLAREVREAAASREPPTMQAPEGAANAEETPTPKPPDQPPPQSAPIPRSAASATKTTVAEAGRAGGKESAKTKRANMKWIPRALNIGRARYESSPTASYASVARAIVKDCQLAGVTCPKAETLAAWVSEQRKPDGEFPESGGESPE
jgi:hypothetical protein